MLLIIIVILAVILTSYSIHDIYYLRVKGRGSSQGGSIPRPSPSSGDWPRITCVIPAANEEKTIGPKVSNLKKAYPPDKMEIMVVLNNSTDSTAEICRELDVTLIESAPGKQMALEAARLKATTDYILVTDADVKLETDTVKKLVADLQDAPDDVIVVSGYCEYSFNRKSRTGKKMNEHEHKQAYLCELQGVDASSAIIQGPCYVYKRELFPSYPTGAMEDELSVAIEIAASGYRARTNAGARCFQYVDTEPLRLISMLTRHAGRQVHSCLKQFGVIFNRRAGAYSRFIFPFYIFIPRCLPIVTLFVLSIPFLVDLNIGYFFPCCIAAFIFIAALNPFVAMQIIAIHLGWLYLITHRKHASTWHNDNRARIKFSGESQGS